MLTFGLDFDDTFTAAPELWARFIKDAESRGHRVYIVTARRDTDENRMEVRLAQIEYGTNVSTIFSSLGSKLHAAEKRGVKIDIWIDDNPTALVNGH